jgi:signal transduction histidine kinase/CheY-like chemotaxis protein
LRTHASIACTAGAAALFTLLVSVLSVIEFAYRNPALHVAVETAAALISIVAAQLIYGRFRQSYQLADLLLTASLSVFAVANLLFSTVPDIAASQGGTFATWTSVCARLLGAALMALAAVVPERTLHHPARQTRRVAVACAAAVAGVALAVALAGDRLPEAIAPDLSPEGAGRPRVVGDPIVLGAHLVVMVLFAVAAVGFAGRAVRTRDELSRWLAIAATLAAFAWLNYFLFPSLYSPYFYAGDVLRLGFFTALFIGGALELRRTRAVLATAAVLQERRRIARDIHDGVAQDLAFILLQVRRLARRPDAPVAMEQMVVAGGTGAGRVAPRDRRARAVRRRAADRRRAGHRGRDRRARGRLARDGPRRHRGRTLQCAEGPAPGAAGGDHQRDAARGRRDDQDRAARGSRRVPQRDRRRAGLRCRCGRGDGPAGPAEHGRAGARARWRVGDRLRAGVRHARRGETPVTEAGRVLLAERDGPTRAGLRLALGGAGFDVVAEASEHAGAIEAALEHRPDIALVGTDLPGGGIDAVRTVAERLPATKVIVLSPDPDGRELLEAVLAGAAGYLSKEIAADRLPHAIRGVLRG